jgi:F0F1-type ATP synthase assembly protein I
MLRVILVQVTVGAFLILLGFFGGRAQFFGAVAGVLVALLPNVLFAVYLWVQSRKAVEVARFYVGVGLKWLLSVALLVVVWQQYGAQVSPLYFWLAYIVVLMAHNLGLLRRSE